LALTRRIRHSSFSVSERNQARGQRRDITEDEVPEAPLQLNPQED
jgi:hypothetical protein